MHSYDRKYVTSMAGLCKLGCLLCSFIGCLCILCSSVRATNLRGCFYMAAALGGFLATLALLLAHSLQVWERPLCCGSRTLWTLYVHATLALCYFAASGLVLSLDIGAYTAAGFFGLTAFCINALEAYISYRRSQQRTVATQTELLS